MLGKKYILIGIIIAVIIVATATYATFMQAPLPSPPQTQQPQQVIQTPYQQPADRERQWQLEYERYLKDLYEKARKEGKLTIIGSGVEPLAEVIKKFKEKYPGIEVSAVFLTPGPLQGRLEAEYKAGKLTMDILNVACPSPQFKWILDRGLWVTYLSPLADKLPKEYVVGDVTYAYAASIFFALAYNKDLVPKDKIPKSVLDFANDAFWRGKIGIGDPRGGGATWTMYYLLYNAYGIDLFRKLRENNIVVTSSADATARTAAGTLYGGVIIDGHGISRIKLGAPIGIIYPEKDPLTPIIWCTGITKDAENPNAAKLFIEFLLTEEGQRAVVESGYWSPLYKDLKPLPDIPNIWQLPNLKIYLPGDWEGYKPVLDAFNMNSTLGEIVKALGLS